MLFSEDLSRFLDCVISGFLDVCKFLPRPSTSQEKKHAPCCPSVVHLRHSPLRAKTHFFAANMEFDIMGWSYGFDPD